MSDAIDSLVLPKVASYYASTLAAHGPTAQGVDWNGVDSHERRHTEFLRLVSVDSDASIIDLGCGYGDFFRFLRAYEHRGRFIGYDIAPSMIEKARDLHGEGDDRRWRVGAQPSEVADFAIASGIFNVKDDIPSELWRRYVYQTIDLLARAGSRGFAFNALSLSSDPMRRQPKLFYADPVETLAYCLDRFGRSVALLQDYGLYEFTIIVRNTRSHQQRQLNRG